MLGWEMNPQPCDHRRRDSNGPTHSTVLHILDQVARLTEKRKGNIYKTQIGQCQTTPTNKLVPNLSLQKYEKSTLL